MSWAARAACRGMDTDLFFPIRGKASNSEDVRRAKAICAGCPVAEECREEAERLNVREGIWGGLTERERRRRRRALGLLRRSPPPCQPSEIDAERRRALEPFGQPPRLERERIMQARIRAEKRAAQ